MGFADRLLGASPQRPLDLPRSFRQAEAAAVLDADRMQDQQLLRRAPYTSSRLLDRFLRGVHGGRFDLRGHRQVGHTPWARVEVGLASRPARYRRIFIRFGVLLYLWVESAISGRTLEWASLASRSWAKQGRPVSPSHAAVRAAVLPFSVASVVGVLGVVLDAKQRAFHDLVAKTAVVYDWGDRPAELPTPSANG